MDLIKASFAFAALSVAGVAFYNPEAIFGRASRGAEDAALVCATAVAANPVMLQRAYGAAAELCACYGRPMAAVLKPAAFKDVARIFVDPLAPDIGALFSAATRPTGVTPQDQARALTLGLTTCLHDMQTKRKLEAQSGAPKTVTAPQPAVQPSPEVQPPPQSPPQPDPLHPPATEPSHPADPSAKPSSSNAPAKEVDADLRSGAGESGPDPGGAPRAAPDQ